MKAKTILLTVGLLIATLNSVQAGIAGRWEGSLTGDDDQPVRVTLDLDKNEQSEWTASMGIPEENVTGLVVQDVSVKDKTVKFLAVELMMHTFDLTLGPEGTLKGTVSGPTQQTVEFKRTGEAKVELIPDSPAVSEQLEGVWEGMIQTPGREIPMTFYLKNQPDNTVRATFITGGGSSVLPLNHVKQTGRKVEFGMKIAHARFEGTLNEEGTELVGKMIHGHGEGEHVSPLILRKKQ
jgi:hypothetical protein